jgi:phage shock protein PspC (stress-responsive transcriptional regulator)
MNGFDQRRRLYRLRQGRMVAGVCAGLASYLGVDATIVRLVFAVLSIFGGTGVLLYLIAWAVVPEEGDGASLLENVMNKNRNS